VPFQNIPDGVVCQIVTQIGQCSLYPPIAPGAILFSHADSQSGNFLTCCRPPGSSTRTAGVVTTNQISVPCQQGSGRDDRRHFVQCLPPKLFPFGRQSPSLVVVELQTPVTHLFSKDAILLGQICDNLLLMAAHPSGEGKHHK